MIIVWILVIAVPLIFVLWFVTAYNGLIKQKNACENAWSQIDVQLKRRHDLIPNLVETAKGYMKHEKETLENVTKARQQAIDASNIKDRIANENFLTSALRSMFAVSENYPDLKANQSMQELMEELSSTENRISFARQHYNDTVYRFNTTCESIPTNIIAGMFNFQKKEFFEIVDPTERDNVKVEF